MGGMHRRTLLACSVASIGVIAIGQAIAQGTGVWLVTGAEAALPPSPTSRAGRSITRGPAIRQVSPTSSVAANQPFALKVEFAGRGGEKINAASAQVAVLRGSNINITERVKPYITANGIEIADARVPAGTYVLQVTVSDAGGRQSIANVEIDAH